MTWARRPASAIWRAARRSSAATRCGLSRAPLSVAILLAVGVGVVLAYGFYWVIGGFVGTKEDEPAAKIDVYKTALAGVAGIGGAVALVVAYRRQRDAEQGRFVERFGAAAAQLGDQDVAVRIAGVYAMAGVADESSDPGRRQQCIDVLCGYLRLPYDPEHGSSHRTEHVTKITPLRNSDNQCRGTVHPPVAPKRSRSTPNHRQGHLRTPARRCRKQLVDNTISTSPACSSKTPTSAGRAFSGEHTNFVGATFSGEGTNFGGASLAASRPSSAGRRLAASAPTSARRRSAASAPSSAGRV